MILLDARDRAGRISVRWQAKRSPVERRENPVGPGLGTTEQVLSAENLQRVALGPEKSAALIRSMLKT